jgi:hypothetical protein
VGCFFEVGTNMLGTIRIHRYKHVSKLGNLYDLTIYEIWMSFIWVYFKIRNLQVTTSENS